MTTTVFRSTSNFLRVGLPPEEFDYDIDKLGNKVPFKAQKFVNGALEVNDEKIINFLRKHYDNEVNGGTKFWEEKKNYTDSINALHCVPMIGDERRKFDEKEMNCIKGFLDVANKMVPPNKKDRAIKDICKVIDIFMITGIKKPDKEMRMRTVKSIAIEILDLLEDNELLTDNDLNNVVTNAGKEDIGGVENTA